MTRRVACVFAHPDDDTYGIGGSLALHAGADVEITAIVTTSGEAGQIADPSLATPETLGRVREAEDLASWAALGLAPEVRFLRHPDGGVADVPREELVAEYVARLLEACPDVVVTFGPDGITGHEDHVAVGAACTEAFHLARAQAADGFRWLLYSVLRQSRLDALNEELRARGSEPMDPSLPYVPRGVTDAAIGVSVDCSSVYAAKLEALRCHRTQGELEGVPYNLWPAILGVEEFVVAWPERQAGAEPASDLFEGMGGT